MITGDRNIFIPGTEAYARFKLQRGVVEELRAVFWGKGALVMPLFVRGDFDVVTAQDPFWRGLIAWIVARRLGAKFNVQIHTDLSAQSVIRHILAQIILRHADSIRVVSEKIKEQVMHVGVHTSVSVLPIFIDVDKFRSIKRQPHSQKTILWIGRLEKEKNPEEALRILELVRDSGIDAGLVILGTGSLHKRLEATYKLAYVGFEGWTNPLEYFRRADVVVCTSKHESFGASIVESLAAGVPVVAPDVGVAKEAGAIVVPREDLAKAVISVLKNNTHAELKLNLLSKEEWAKAWVNTL